jgi:Zn-dependent protease with chaperone function
MDHPMPLDQVKVGIMDDQQINAANAGGNQFFVTTGLLHKASYDQLRAVLAHELSHQDLNHVAKAQVLGAGPVLAPPSSSRSSRAPARSRRWQASW